MGWLRDCKRPGLIKGAMGLLPTALLLQWCTRLHGSTSHSCAVGRTRGVCGGISASSTAGMG